MKNRTITVVVAAERDAVFSFLARMENLPLWARDTFTVVWRDNGQWKARTPIGEQHVAIVGDERTGVIDLLVGDQPDEMTLWPMRVTCGAHGAVITATLFQAPGQPDEFFEHVGRAWLADMRRLPERFGGGEVTGVPGEGAAFYPGIVTADFYGTWDFYCEHLGFRTVAECDFHVQLAHPSGAQISVLRHELDGPSPELVSATDGRGFWLNLDVADADAEYRRLSAAGLDIVSPPEDKPWGDRMFVVRDPNRVLIALAHRMPSREPLDTRPAAL
jgi:uncharacterized glyoxalase superfamily protein PhnB